MQAVSADTGPPPPRSALAAERLSARLAALSVKRKQAACRIAGATSSARAAVRLGCQRSFAAVAGAVVAVGPPVVAPSAGAARARLVLRAVGARAACGAGSVVAIDEPRLARAACIGFVPRGVAVEVALSLRRALCRCVRRRRARAAAAADAPGVRLVGMIRGAGAAGTRVKPACALRTARPCFSGRTAGAAVGSGCVSGAAAVGRFAARVVVSRARSGTTCEQRAQPRAGDSAKEVQASKPIAKTVRSQSPRAWRGRGVRARRGDPRSART